MIGSRFDPERRMHRAPFRAIRLQYLDLSNIAGPGLRE